MADKPMKMRLLLVELGEYRLKPLWAHSLCALPKVAAFACLTILLGEQWERSCSAHESVNSNIPLGKSGTSLIKLEMISDLAIPLLVRTPEKPLAGWEPRSQSGRRRWAEPTPGWGAHTTSRRESE